MFESHVDKNSEHLATCNNTWSMLCVSIGKYYSSMVYHTCQFI